MNEGNIVLASLPQADGQIKHRPVVVLRRMPPFGDWLVCGISTQLHQAVKDFDEVMEPKQSDFSQSGLKAPSVIRLGFLAVFPTSHFIGTIGSISPERHRGLLSRLCLHLTPNQPKQS